MCQESTSDKFLRRQWSRISSLSRTGWEGVVILPENFLSKSIDVHSYTCLLKWNASEQFRLSMMSSDQMSLLKVLKCCASTTASDSFLILFTFRHRVTLTRSAPSRWNSSKLIVIHKHRSNNVRQWVTELLFRNDRATAATIKTIARDLRYLS